MYNAFRPGTFVRCCPNAPLAFRGLIGEVLSREILSSERFGSSVNRPIQADEILVELEGVPYSIPIQEVEIWSQKPYILIDGIVENRKYPSTFELPSNGEIKRLRLGWYTKIGITFDQEHKVGNDPPVMDLWKDKVGKKTAGNVKAERFWVIVSDLTLPYVTGRVNNDLVYTAFHGVKNGDLISFRRQHILDILRP